ncbi:endoplasmic reticulum resident protein 27 isoform X1 [Ochotona curzoniae]|uniref:endoplasmic reticulum resident protein 27 isoform X1 n=1 Tax=Ochotona curzoniae TaxID=130825 RepID=UPI001B34EC0D|nr:endoplasmic reticulum resident protein 27 isoform X1 [Ochotona curzoniae]
MDTSYPSRLCLFFLMCVLALEVATEVEEPSDGPAATQELMWLTDVPAATAFIAAAEVALIGFFQDLELPVVSIFRDMVQNFQDVSFGISNNSEVLTHYNITGNTISLFRLADNEQVNLEGEVIESLNADKLSQFIETNNLHLVTEYNAVTAVGLFSSNIQIHLLLVINKASPEYKENMHRFQKAAKHLRGKALFVLVDSGKKENEKAVSYFKLKKSQLPALTIYRTVDDKWDALPVSEVSVERVQNFYEGFLEGKLLSENHKSEEKTSKVEL